MEHDMGANIEFGIGSLGAGLGGRGGGGGTGPMTYADVSRGIQRIFKERQETMTIVGLEGAFQDRFGVSIPEVAGIATRDYLHRKKNVFEYDVQQDTVYLQPSILAGPPIADPSLPKDENFVLDEFERLIEDLGPVCYVSALCGKFIQRNGVSVTSITSTRPLDLLKRHPTRFLIVGGGNVSLTKYKNYPEVQSVVTRGTGKGQRAARALQDAQLPIPDIITEQDVVEEFRRLIAQDGGECVYISSLCGRFLQRFRKPVTNIINSRPADFLRKYADVFELVGGGNVRLRPQGAGAAAPSDATQNWDRSGSGGPSGPPGVGVGPAAGPMGSTAPSGGEMSWGGSGPCLTGLPPSEQAPPSWATRAPPTAIPAPSLPPSSGGQPQQLEGSGPGATLDDAFCYELLRDVAPEDYATMMMARVRDLSQLLQERSFLSIEEILIGGAIGKNLSVRGPTEEVELILYVNGMPDSDHDKWLPHVLETLLAVLEMALGSKAQGFRTTGGPSAELVLIGDPSGGGKGAGPIPDLIVSLIVAPVPGSRTLLLQRISKAPAADQRYLTPSLAKEALDLVANQPDDVRAAMQMIRWWCGQQSWNSPMTKPPGYLLELLVVFCAERSKTGPGEPISGPAALVKASLDLCASLPTLWVLWDGTGVALFEVSEVNPDLLQQAPLVVDPVNPGVNVADPAHFDCAELAARATRAGPGEYDRLRVFFEVGDLAKRRL